MKKIISILIITTSLVSCSFKSKDALETQENVITATEALERSINPNTDSDGDFVKDQQEIDLGQNPFVANLPELKVRFIQNYKIRVDREENGTGKLTHFEIDTKVNQDNPDFKYRVGSIFIRENSFAHASNVGKFSTHSWGDIEDNDLSWVKYPEVDPKFFHQEALKYKNLIGDNSTVNNIKITLENSIKLKAHKNFRSIKNLELNFYYFDYEKDSYELLGTKLVERHFNSGVNETFEVTLENAPINLIRENYFQKGEFIISEIKDFEIPDLKTTYSQLMKSVKEKTLPVVFNTPLESSISYVAVDQMGKSINEVLKELFDKKVEIKENKIVKINQFANNLPDFTYLKEINGLDKKGKWFVLTNRITKHYLDYRFKKSDRLVLSYILGSELANQSNEKIYSFSQNVDGKNDYKVIPLGNVSPNSKVEFQIRPEKRVGTNHVSFPEILDQKQGSCGKNCVQLKKYCRWDITIPKPYDEPLKFDKELSGEIKKISLIVNDSEFSLSKLANDKKVSVSWSGESLNVEIHDIEQIIKINNFEENLLSLKVKTESQKVRVGVVLSQVDGHWQGPGGCPFFTPMHSLNLKIPISNHSIHLGKIKYAHDKVVRPEQKHLISYSDDQTLFKRISISVSSVVNNFHN